MKLGLYSITYLGLWYRGDALTLEQLILRAREYGYEGVEIDGKRPHGNPSDLPPRRCLELRRFAGDAGVEIYAVAANNDFSSPIPEHREAQLVYVRELIRMTAELGARLLRVFAAWPGVTESGDAARYDIARNIWHATQQGIAAEDTWARCREGLAEAAIYAGEHGLTLALQNHPPVIEHWRDMLRMISEVGSPHLKACLDAPLAAKQGAADMRIPARETGVLQALSHFGGEYERDASGELVGLVRRPDGTLAREDFYAAFVDGMREIGYEGYLGYELCHPLPAVGGRTVGIEFADENACLAAEYLRKLMGRPIPARI